MALAIAVSMVAVVVISELIVKLGLHLILTATQSL
jgi:hypothetical protein